MKLTNREKYLLILLGVILASFLYFKFIFLSEDSKIKKLNAKYNQELSSYNMANGAKDQIKQIDGQIKELGNMLSDGINKISEPIRTPELLSELDKAAVDNKVTIDDIKFSGNGAAVKGEYKENTDDNNLTQQARGDASNTAQQGTGQDASNNIAPANTSNEKEKKDSNVTMITISFSFKCEYKNFLSFLKYYENNKRLFVTYKFEIAGNGKECTGVIAISAFAIKKDDSDFLYLVKAGADRTSPFESQKTTQSDTPAVTPTTP